MKSHKQPTGLRKLWSKAFYGKYANWPKTLWYHLFIKKMVFNKKATRAQNSNEKPLKVIFFVLNIGMWKYDSLFRLLLNDSRFNPVIIPYPILWHSKEDLKNAEKGIVDYCKKHGFPYIIGYNIDTQEYIPAKELKADFVSYSQQYNNCPDFWKVEKFYRDSLIFTYPYGLPVSHPTSFSHFNNLLIQNVAWRQFHGDKTYGKLYQKNFITRGKNFLWVGNVFYDKLLRKKSDHLPWKSIEHTRKRIIWAPHHTIGQNDDLPFSHFLEINELMIDIAQEYSNQIDFAFKPHPMLYHRLCETWGRERTDVYYKKWDEMQNTCLVQGDYTDIFLTSDGMIHDCAGFTLEYLFVNKPVLYVNFRNVDMSKYMNSTSLACYQQHYIAQKEADIRTFIDNIIIAGNDHKSAQRKVFAMENLFPPNTESVGKNMYNEFLSFVK